jgi:hypothetical protein
MVDITPLPGHLLDTNMTGPAQPLTSTPIDAAQMPSLPVSDIENLRYSICQMAVSDSAFTPKPFSGATKDAEKAEEWLEYFSHYTEAVQTVADGSSCGMATLITTSHNRRL